MITRRTMLKGMAAIAASSGLLVPGAAFARIPGEKRLVVLLLRGGLDGLAAVAPYGDRDYYNLRGELALNKPGTANGTLDLDGFFGFHPSLKQFHNLYQANELAVFHATASPFHTRSHFDAQDLLENGRTNPHGSRDGWLNRALQLIGPSDNRLGIAIGHSIPLILRGEAKVNSWAPAHLPELDDQFLYRLSMLYEQDSLFREALHSGMQTDELAERALADSPKFNKMRGRNASTGLAKVVAKFLREKDGPRVAALDMGGWDTHARQGAEQGTLAQLLGSLDSGIATLKQELGPVWSDTAVLVLTEFGRTAAVNGTGGTDHGTAGTSFLLGGAINGGQLIAKWPGLSKSRLYEGRDLAPTMDLRSPIAAVLNQHLGIPLADIQRHVFPGLRDESRLVGRIV